MKERVIIIHYYYRRYLSSRISGARHSAWNTSSPLSKRFSELFHFICKTERGHAPPAGASSRWITISIYYALHDMSVCRKFFAARFLFARRKQLALLGQYHHLNSYWDANAATTIPFIEDDEAWFKSCGDMRHAIIHIEAAARRHARLLLLPP